MCYRIDIYIYEYIYIVNLFSITSKTCEIELRFKNYIRSFTKDGVKINSSMVIPLSLPNIYFRVITRQLIN